MFNLSKETNRLKQLRHDKVHGLPYKRLPKDSKVQHIDDTLFDIKAEQESVFMARRFHNHSIGFGRRLSKVRGQKHHPGGGFAGHSIKGK